MFDSFVERFHVVGLKAPIDTTSSAFATAFVNMRETHTVNFYCFFGVITSTSADQVPTVTIEAASTNASGSEAQIPFSYRASGAVGTDSWGAITAVAAATGMQPATTDDGKMFVITIEPAAVLATKSNASWLRVVVTPDAGSSACVVAVWAEYLPRYAGNSQDTAS